MTGPTRGPDPGGPSMTLRRLIPVLLLALGVQSSPSWAQVRWRQDYSRARQEATRKNLPLVISFRTPACSWCDQMEARTFGDPAVAARINEGFIPLKIDSSTETMLTRALQVATFPTTVVASPQGQVLAYQKGFVDAERMQQLLRQFESAPATGAQVAGKVEPRQAEASRLLSQAKADFSARQYLCCLDRCDVLVRDFADLPEGEEASRLARQIREDVECLQQLCDSLTQRHASVYLALAEAKLRQGHPQQAIFYLERLIQAFPNTRFAEMAQVRLSRIQGPRQ